MTVEDLKPVDHIQDLVAHSKLLKLRAFLHGLIELKDLKMRPDESTCLDHTYFAKETVFLTPPQTPVSDFSASKSGCKLDNLWTASSQIGDFEFDLEVFHTNYHTEEEEMDDRFCDFVEDFQDLRKPMLKKDCMWGTGQWLGSHGSRHVKTSSISSASSDIIPLTGRASVTPLSFDIRPVSTTPTYLDEKIHSTFAPISETSSVADNERIEANSTTATAFPELSLLPSPNETESDEEIDVVNLVEKTYSTLGRSPTPSMAPQSPQDIKELSDSGPESPVNVVNNMKVLQRRMFQKQYSGNPRGGGRVSHNDLERKRRDELKRKFESLRQSIPELEGNDRAPKVMVLKKARELIPCLQLEEKRLVLEKEKLRSSNVVLMERLVALTRHRVFVPPCSRDTWAVQ